MSMKFFFVGRNKSPTIDTITIAISFVVASIVILSFSTVAFSNVLSSHDAAVPTATTTENTCFQCTMYSVMLNITETSVGVIYGNDEGSPIFQFTTNSSMNFAFDALQCQNASFINFDNMQYTDGGPLKPFNVQIYSPNGTLVLSQTFPITYPPTCGCISYEIYCPPSRTQSSSESVTTLVNTTSSLSDIPGFSIPVTTPLGEEALIGVSGSNILSNQISNMTLSENTTTNQLLLSFDTSALTSDNPITIAIPSNAVPPGYSPPLVYIDSNIASGQSYYTSSGSYYVTFSLSSSSPKQQHHIVIVFSSGSSSSGAKNPITSGVPSYMAPPESYEIIAAIIAAALTCTGSFLFLRRRRD